MKYSISGEPVWWGNEKMTSQIQSPFIKCFCDAPGKVLDLGCGRGTMLRLFANAGVEAYGIDIARETVARCRKEGLEVYQEEALAHLRTLKECALGGIFSGHVIEHLSPQQVLDFIREAKRVLMPGGRVLIMTPNLKDLRTVERFWLDLSHVRPYPRKLLEMLLRQEGFKRVRAVRCKEPYHNVFERAVKIFLKFWFMGFMFTGHLVVVTEK